jgi:hypothetical protein
MRALRSALRQLRSALRHWAVSAIAAFGNYNTCPAGAVAVHDAGLAVLPPAAGLPVADLQPALQPAQSTMTDTALQKSWFETAVATVTAATGATPAPGPVRTAVNLLAVAAGRPDLQYLHKSGYRAVNQRLVALTAVGQKRGREEPRARPARRRTGGAVRRRPGGGVA